MEEICKILFLMAVSNDFIYHNKRDKFTLDDSLDVGQGSIYIIAKHVTLNASLNGKEIAIFSKTFKGIEQLRSERILVVSKKIFVPDFFPDATVQSPKAFRKEWQNGGKIKRLDAARNFFASL